MMRAPPRTSRKRFDLRGKDPLELERRVGVLRNALRRQDGDVVRVRWHRDAAGGHLVARVVYELPMLNRLCAMPVDEPARATGPKTLNGR